ncbi:MAG: flagellar export protein FliJ [Methylotenera sp.]|nr:flagellar export protein FliJ [Oligoflexia bacterium]
MKRFRFKFTAVEKVRQSRQDEALRVLAQAQSMFQEATTFKNRLVQALNDSLLRRENLGREFTSVMAFQLENSFLAGQRVRILQAENFIKKASKNVEKCLRAYLVTRRELKMIEVLREKAFAEFRKEKNKQEQKVTDDIYISRANLNQAGVNADELANEFDDELEEESA